MNRTSADVERDVETTRNNLDRTVEALKDKMNPREIVDEAKSALGGAGQQMLATLMRQARENPLPFALTSAGLLWMLTDAAKSADGAAATSTSGGAQRAAGKVADGAGDLADNARERLGDAADAAGHMVDEAGEAGRAALQRASDAVTGAVTDAAGAARQAGRGLGGAFSDMIDREPLLVGALGLFVGLAVGAALPPTELEKEYVGPLHDKLMEKGETLAREGLAQAKDAAEAAYDAARSSLSGEDADGAGTDGRQEAHSSTDRNPGVAALDS